MSESVPRMETLPTRVGQSRTARKGTEDKGKSGSIVARLSHELAALEKRDWQLWMIVSGTGILVGAGLVALLFPAAIMHEGVVRFELVVSRELFVALVALLTLFNTYVISRRFALRRLREQVISTTIQNELIRLQSFTDPLTEVYNRRALDDMAAKYMSRAQRLEKPLTFIVVDADRFKEINTRFGHLTGDFVIAGIAAILQSSVRGSDSVVRYGGDEFLVILADAPLEGAKVVVNRVYRGVEDWNDAKHLEGFELALSIGLAAWAPERSLDQVLNEADQNMYAEKESRKRSPR